MKFQDLCQAGQRKIQYAIGLADESWENCAGWWKPEGKTGSAVEDMRRWFAAWEKFKESIQTQDFEDAFMQWLADAFPGKELLSPLFSEAKFHGGPSHLRLHDAYEIAKRLTSTQEEDDA
jgi:hypothetical protein